MRMRYINLHFTYLLAWKTVRRKDGQTNRQLSTANTTLMHDIARVKIKETYNLNSSLQLCNPPSFLLSFLTIMVSRWHYW